MKSILSLHVMFTTFAISSTKKQFSRSEKNVVPPGCDEVKPGEFPHQVMVIKVDSYLMCGGSLVTPNRVVTAGQCCDG